MEDHDFRFDQESIDILKFRYSCIQLDILEATTAWEKLYWEAKLWLCSEAINLRLMNANCGRVRHWTYKQPVIQKTKKQTEHYP